MNIHCLAAVKKVEDLTGEKQHEAWNLLANLGLDKDHPEQVRALTIQLFDELENVHKFGPKERTLLESAAILHDVGTAIRRKKHHKHSMRLILEANLPSYTSNEKLIIANIARYHRKALPKPKHSTFSLLSADDQEKVKKLAALLRLADAFIRSKESSIRGIHCHYNGEFVEIEIDSPDDCVNEISSFQRKKNLFMQVYNIDIVVSCKEKQVSYV